MNKRSWLLIGGNGWIGGMIHRLLRERGEHVHLFPTKILGFGQLAEVRQAIINDKVTHIIDCAGKTRGEQVNSIDYLQGKLRENLVNNVLVHQVVMEAAAKFPKVHLTLLGTGCIYESQSELQEFQEDSPANFFGSDYSAVKSVLDEWVRWKSAEQSILHARIRMPIDSRPHPANLINKLISYDRITDRPNSMSCLPDLLPILVELAMAKQEGVMNLVNPGYITHAQIVSAYNEIVQPRTYEVMTVEEEQKIVKAARSNNVLSTSRLVTACKDLGIRAPLRIDEAVAECLRVMKLWQAPAELPLKFSRRALVTGTSGFVGFHLASKLVQDGWQVIGLDKDDPKPHMVIEGVEYLCLDLADIAKMEQYFSQKRAFHTIFHLASETHVDYSYVRPFDFTLSNVLGTHVLLEMVRRYCPSLVTFYLCSSDEVQSSDVLQTERDRCHTTNPYSSSKLSQEAFANAYYSSYRVPVVIGRANNIFGPYQTVDKLVAKAFFTALNTTQTETPVFYVHGTGSAQRSFIYVSDIVQAIIFIAEHGKKGEIYNIAAPCELTVMQVLTDVNEILQGRKCPQLSFQYVADRPYQDQRYLISGEKLARLGFEPKVGWHEGLRKTFEFYFTN